jgi:hypothetical protein
MCMIRSRPGAVLQPERGLQDRQAGKLGADKYGRFCHALGCMHISLRLRRASFLLFTDVLLSLLPGKAGADVLFVDPARKSSTLGVTVSPVRVDSLDAFGDLDTVASRLLQAERAKVRPLSGSRISHTACP